MDFFRIEKNIRFLKTANISLSEKLDKVLNMRLIPSNRNVLEFIPDSDILTPINRPKLWISRIKKTSKIQSRTPKNGPQEVLGRLVNREGQSLLQQACYYGKISIIQKLLSEGSDINQEDWYGNTALLYAIKANQPKVVKELLKYPNLNVTQKYGLRHETALIKAIKQGSAEIVCDFCRLRNEVIGKQDVDGRSALFHAIIRGNTEMVGELIKAGSREKDLIDYKGFNAVYLAIEAGEVNAVQALLSHSEFSISESVCVKLLLMGCYGNKIKLVESTIPHLSISCKIREDGLSPLLISYTLGFTEITDLLIDNSFNEEIDYVSPQGDFLFMLACRKNDKKIVEKLISLDCDFSLIDSKQRTVLHEVCEKGFNEILEMLLRRSVNINAKDFLGFTPLILAVKSSKKETVEILVRRGADVNIKDLCGRDAKSYAHREIADVLVNYSITRRPKKNWNFRKILSDS